MQVNLHHIDVPSGEREEVIASEKPAVTKAAQAYRMLGG